MLCKLERQPHKRPAPARSQEGVTGLQSQEPEDCFAVSLVHWPGSAQEERKRTVRRTHSPLLYSTAPTLVAPCHLQKDRRSLSRSTLFSSSLMWREVPTLSSAQRPAQSPWLPQMPRLPREEKRGAGSRSRPRPVLAASVSARRGLLPSASSPELGCPSVSWRISIRVKELKAIEGTPCLKGCSGEHKGTWEALRTLMEKNPFC